MLQAKKNVKFLDCVNMIAVYNDSYVILVSGFDRNRKWPVFSESHNVMAWHYDIPRCDVISY